VSAQTLRVCLLFVFFVLLYNCLFLFFFSYLVEIKDEIQLADVSKELVQHFYKEMYGFQVGQLVVVGVDAGAKEEAGISTVYDLRGSSEFDKVGLVLLISGCDKTVDLGWGCASDMLWWWWWWWCYESDNCTPRLSS
jgi:hypothetical protein